MKILLSGHSGHSWHAVSPSYYVLEGYPVELLYHDRAWYLSFEASFDNARPWPSRDAAACAIAQAFIDHQMQDHGVL